MFIACSSSKSEPVAKVPEKKEPENKEPPPPKGKDGKGGEHPPLIPPFVREGLKLSADQEKQLAALETEFHERFMKILTPDQQKKLREMGPKGPGGDRFPDGPKFDKGGKGEPPPQ
jgi:hypothetical protein